MSPPPPLPPLRPGQAALLLVDLQNGTCGPGQTRLDLIRWVMRLLPLIPLAQIAGVVATLRPRRPSWQAPTAPVCRRS